MKVNMHEAKSQLSRLGRLAWEGEEIVIARAGEPYLRLEPYREEKLEPFEEIMNPKIFPDET